MKQTAKKVRRLYNNSVVVGFAGSVADAFTLYASVSEAKLEQYSGFARTRSGGTSCRTGGADKNLRRLEAMLIAADASGLLLISGSGEVIDPDEGIAAIGSAGCTALAAGRHFEEQHSALRRGDHEEGAWRSPRRFCVFTNDNISCWRKCVRKVEMKDALTPRQIVEELDRYIIGQDSKARCRDRAEELRLAALRSTPRCRRRLRRKTSSWVGPTGVGKT